MDLYDAQILCKKLMREHLDDKGLMGWVFKWDHAKKRAGSCTYGKKIITLSMPLTKLHPDEQVMDTILHEIAHAQAGHRAGHGVEWRMAARAVGAKPERCYSPEKDGLETVEAAWVGTCPSGLHTAKFHRAPLRVSSCQKCSVHHFGQSTWTWKFIYTWTKNGQPVEAAAISERYAREYARLALKHGFDPHRVD